jgi:hypothetical protein
MTLELATKLAELEYKGDSYGVRVTDPAIGDEMQRIHVLAIEHRAMGRLDDCAKPRTS